VAALVVDVLVDRAADAPDAADALAADAVEAAVLVREMAAEAVGQDVGNAAGERSWESLGGRYAAKERDDGVMVAQLAVPVEPVEHAVEPVVARRQRLVELLVAAVAVAPFASSVGPAIERLVVTTWRPAAAALPSFAAVVGAKAADGRGPDYRSCRYLDSHSVLRLSVWKCMDADTLGSSVDPRRPAVAWRGDGSDTREGVDCESRLPATDAREIKAVDGVRPWPGCQGGMWDQNTHVSPRCLRWNPTSFYRLFTAPNWFVVGPRIP